MSKTLYTILAWLFLPLWVAGQGIEVHVSNDNLEQGQTFLVTYTYDNKLKDFQLPEFKGFDVFNAGKSTNITIINGKITNTTSQTLTLRALSPGTYAIQPARGLYKGKVVASAAFKITVKPASAVSSDQNETSQQGTEVSPSATNWRENIFVVADADKRKAYVGEPIIVTYTLYRRIDYRSLEIEKEPVFKSFLSEYMEMGEGEEEGLCTFGGKQYYCQTFRRLALFPTQVGKIKIEPLSLRGVILIEESDPFFGFFNTTEPKAVAFSSNPIQLEVLPLPEKGQPRNFSGMVGSYEVSRTVGKQQAVAGRALPVEININGKGNIRSISPPTLNLPEGIDVFEPEITDAYQKKGKIFGGSRTFKYTLVPEKAGPLLLPPQEINWFDPNTAQYVSMELSAISIEVAPGTNGNHNIMEDDISPSLQIKTSFSKKKEKAQWPLAVAGTLPLAAVLLILLFHRKNKSENTTGKIEVAQWPVFNGENKREDYLALSGAIQSGLVQKLSLDMDTPLPSALSTIQDPATRERLSYILRACERAAYSPLPSEPVEQLSLQAQALLQDLPTKHPAMS
jgi:hypothetical protein